MKIVDSRTKHVHLLFFHDRGKLRTFGMGGRMFLVHNERTKLTATWLNTLATALVAAGAFAPGAAVFYGISNIQLGRGFLAMVLIGCAALGVAIHVVALRLLGRMRE